MNDKSIMAKKVKIWYDMEADYLEVIFEKSRLF